MALEHPHADHHDSLDDGGVHAHVSSAQFYWGIFAALVLLTIATVKVSYYDFGSLNILVALLIASIKATLVATFFMHLRYDSLFNTLTFIASFLFLALFILLTYDDLGHRAKYDVDYGSSVMLRTGQAAPGGMPATTATANEVPGAPPGPAEKK
jgi:cytochrome c oxidase subunit 4